MPKLVPINSMVRTPINESKLKVSKISDNSNISGKSHLRRNTDILEITRSNRELRFELRDRDLKISHLQEDLSKKEIELETLYKQLEYFKNLRVSCQQCGSSTSVQDPFASVWLVWILTNFSVWLNWQNSMLFANFFLFIFFNQWNFFL